MKLNKDKHIGRVLFIVEGSHTEFSILRQIFCKISEDTLIKAADEFLKYLLSEQVAFDIDKFSEASHAVFTKQEAEYVSGRGFRLFSMLTLAFLQMGIIETEEAPQQ